MAGEIEAYQDALVQLRNHEEAAKKTFAAIRAFADATERGWTKISVDNVGMPVDVVFSGRGVFSPKKWPDGEQIAALFTKWHELNRTCRAQWDRIPHERQVGLVPPTDGRPT